MKKALPLLFIAALFTTSCKETWTQEDKNSFYTACMEDAQPNYGDKAKPYCDCVIGKIMAKYPHVSDALEHINELAADPEVRSCKPVVGN
jgi:hypothetical protein